LDPGGAGTWNGFEQRRQTINFPAGNGCPLFINALQAGQAMRVIPCGAAGRVIPPEAFGCGGGTFPGGFARVVGLAPALGASDVFPAAGLGARDVFFTAGDCANVVFLMPTVGGDPSLVF
jgi:hypothetical protein